MTTETVANARGASAAHNWQRPERDVTLLDLLDRLLEGGVVINGDLTLAVADIDLVRVGLRLVVGSVDTLECDRDDGGIRIGVPGT
ncbi:MAG: gas vesicle protein [Actinobacteria bacterium]|nr:gas vesicle protein [Actinomycetota bacterium]